MFLLVSLLLFQSLISASCITNPADQNCATYRYPDANATSDLSLLCSQMPFMVGCSIQQSCAKATSSADSCAPFSILGDICAADMPRMQACNSYVSLCTVIDGKTGTAFTGVGNRTIVRQCADQAPIPFLVSTFEASASVKSICSEMNMPGCEQCIDTGTTFMNCDLLDTYSTLCMSMTNMRQCSAWRTMCTANPSFAFCKSKLSQSPPPSMKMFFHTGFADYILFEKWVPRNSAQYFGSIILLFLLSVLYEFLVSLNARIEKMWSATNPCAARYPFNSTHEINSETNEDTSPTFIALSRFFMRFSISTLGYALMLVTMTFNLGLYFTVMIGLSFGYVAFAGIARQNHPGGSNDELAGSREACC